LDWDQAGQLLADKTRPGVIEPEAMIEATDVSGARTFALKVPDDSMEPLFGKGEMIFVNPDLEWQPGDYVIAHHVTGHSETTLLRQVARNGDQCLLHPLNQSYEDVPVMNQEEVWGKVVRLRKNV
jgi:SOS-response transcriptional repressor LexA